MRQPNHEAVNAASEALAAGGSIAQAAEAAGVTRRTIERWRERGRDELARAPLARLALEADRPAAPSDGVAPLSEADLVELLEAQARRGNITALRLLLERAQRARPIDDVFRDLMPEAWR